MTQITTGVSELLQDTLRERGMSMRDLAIRLEVTYEYVRRVCNGEVVPAKPMLKLICTELKLNFKDVERLWVTDKITKEYGQIPLELAGKKPGMATIERHWDNLTEEQQKDVTAMVVQWARRRSA